MRGSGQGIRARRAGVGRWLCVVAALTLVTCGASSSFAQDTFKFTQQQTGFAPPGGWVIAAADLFPDDFTDFAAYHPSNDTLWPCQNEAGSFGDCLQPKTLQFDGGYRLVRVDVNEDGRDDIVAYRENTTVPHTPGIHLWAEIVTMTATAFSNDQRGQRLNSDFPSGWTLYPGDFDADGFDDLVGYLSADGQIRLFGGDAADSFFDSTEVILTTVTPAAGWTFIPGDFNGDGHLDLMGYRAASGNFKLCRGTASALKCDENWGSVPGSQAGWQFVPGRFHRNSPRLDIAGYRPSDGSLWVARNTGSKLVFEKWNTLTPKTGWRFLSGYYARSIGHTAPQSLFAYRSDNGSFRIGRPADKNSAQASGLRAGD